MPWSAGWSSRAAGRAARAGGLAGGCGRGTGRRCRARRRAGRPGAAGRRRCWPVWVSASTATATAWPRRVSAEDGRGHHRGPAGWARLGDLGVAGVAAAQRAQDDLVQRVADGDRDQAGDPDQAEQRRVLQFHGQGVAARDPGDQHADGEAGRRRPRPAGSAAPDDQDGQGVDDRDGARQGQGHGRAAGVRPDQVVGQQRDDEVDGHAGQAGQGGPARRPLCPGRVPCRSGRPGGRRCRCWAGVMVPGRGPGTVAVVLITAVPSGCGRPGRGRRGPGP